MSRIVAFRLAEPQGNDATTMGKEREKSGGGEREDGGNEALPCPLHLRPLMYRLESLEPNVLEAVESVVIKLIRDYGGTIRSYHDSYRVVTLMSEGLTIEEAYCDNDRYRDRRLMGMSVDQYLPPKSASVLREMVERLQRTGMKQRFELRRTFGGHHHDYYTLLGNRPAGGYIAIADVFVSVADS